MQHPMRSVFLSGLSLAVLLLAFSGALLAQFPDCPGSEARNELTWHSGPYSITASTPVDRPICNTGGCCDKIIITGVPAGWSVKGWYARSYLFTTMCTNGDPGAIQYFEGDPQPSEGIYTPENVNVVSDGNPVEILVCFPKTHDWPSFELHVDLAIGVFDDFGVLQTWVGTDGYIGPGQDWDPACYTLGCTPGFWRNHNETRLRNQYLIWPGGYTTGQSFNSAFGCGPTDVTLLQAVEMGGGGENKVLRHCTAALLNAAYTDNNTFEGSCETFDTQTPSVDDVKGWVCAAYASGQYEAAGNLCEAMNESLCPYDGVWMNTDDGSCFGTPCNPELQ